MKSNSLRLRRHSVNSSATEQSTQLQLLSQTAAELQAGSTMFSSSFTANDNCNQSALHSRLTHFQQRPYSNFDTYPPKKTSSLHHPSPKQTPTTLANNLESTKHAMSIRNSPLRRFYTKRLTPATKRSYSESSTEKQLHKYTTSDSSQEEDELMMSAAAMSDKQRKSTRKGFSNGLQTKYKTKPISGNTEDDSAADCCAIFGKRSQHISDMIDIAIRVVLVVVFCKLETQTAFKRIIHAEEMWMYKNPRTKDYVSPLSLILAVIFGPLLVSLIHLSLTKDRKDFRAATWTWTLCLGLNGLVTSLLKITVGRPRPDYFYRCFPDGVLHLSHNATGTDNMLDLFNCTGSLRDINEGRKSFPSGHSSFAFAAFGFITYYVGAKLHAFNHRGRGESWRLFISMTPLVLAALIAVSRTCDYHHHWEDVTIGSIIGLLVSYYIYRQYYPSIFSANCHRPYPRVVHQVKAMPESFPTRHRRRLHSYKRVPSEEGVDDLLCEEQGEGVFPNDTEKRPLIHEQKTDNKWF